MPPFWDEDRVKEQFKGYGEIERVVLARNMSTAKRKDFGFVNFTNHEAAVACVEGINDTELGDGKSKVPIVPCLFLQALLLFLFGFTLGAKVLMDHLCYNVMYVFDILLLPWIG